jgi:hypothetical protein
VARWNAQPTEKGNDIDTDYRNPARVRTYGVTCLKALLCQPEALDGTTWKMLIDGLMTCSFTVHSADWLRFVK